MWSANVISGTKKPMEQLGFIIGKQSDLPRVLIPVPDPTPQKFLSCKPTFHGFLRRASCLQNSPTISCELAAYLSLENTPV